MDPVTLATTAVGLVSPYLTKAADKAVEKIGEQLPETVGKAWNAIRRKFAGKPAAEEALADWTANPQEQYVQSAFVHQLRKVCEADPTFAAEFARLLAEAQPSSNDTLINTGSGAIATHGGAAAGAGGVVIGGAVHGSIIMGGGQKKE